MKNDFVLEGERLDDLQRNHYKIIQNPDTFCFGMDAVLLSHFAKVKKEGRAIDLGTGNGVIPILLEAKTDGQEFVGLEIQPSIADMADRSVRYNHLEEKVKIVVGDIKEASSIFGPASFDVVTSNPPYMTNHHGLVNPDAPKAIARHELLCSLDDVVREASKLLKVNGKLFMVHRPFRLIEITSTMTKYHLEPKRIRFVFPYVDKEPNMVLIEAVKGGKSRVTIEKPLIVYESINQYTKEVLEMYE